MTRGKSLLDDAGSSARLKYGMAIGRPWQEVVTPALILDLPIAKRNIHRMAVRISELPAEIRPHIKVHKSPELARMQIDSGAIGLSTATVWEAVVMAAAGIDDIFIVNTIAGRQKIAAVVELARSHRVLVAVDDLGNAAELSRAAEDASVELGVMIEVDTGMDRAGTDTIEDALQLARGLSRLPGLRLEGLTGYEGHCSLTPERSLRQQRQRAAMSFFLETADRVQADGIPLSILSAGGTATWEWTAATPRITEIQAGSYVVMDNFHGQMAPEFDKAVFVAATVISHPPDRVIVDAGNKSIGAPALASLRERELDVVRFDEEHGVFAADAGTPLRVGDVVSLVPGYAPSTANWYDCYHVLEDGVVVDIWPILPRGPGHHGLVGAD
jgi:D-serine deaminase-like pyridoxal phosphate-dependent protein